MTVLTAVFAGISAIGGLGGLAGFLYAGAYRRRINAEAAKLEVEPSALLNTAAMEQVDRLIRQVKLAEAKNERLESHVRELEDELRRHGITPPRWPPLKVADDDTA